MNYPDKVAIIGDDTLAQGFKLAGIEDFFIVPDEQVEAKVNELLSNPSYGILIVSERLVEGFDWRLKKKIEASAKPVLIAVPERKGAVEQSESINKLIKRAIGFDITKKS
jgi:vacuolar-type H+-ATPase subunit F/Vma7